MSEQLFKGEFKVPLVPMTKKQVIRVIFYGSLNPEIEVTSADYKKFNKMIGPVKPKLSKAWQDGRGKFIMTPREVQFIYDFYYGDKAQPTITG